MLHQLKHWPLVVQKLSGVWLSPHRYVQRVLVEGATGEEAVLMLTLVKQVRVQPQVRRIDQQMGVRLCRQLGLPAAILWPS